jgi:hypothetical protein
MNWILIGILMYGLILVRMEPVQKKVYVDDDEFWTDDMREELAKMNTHTF